MSERTTLCGCCGYTFEVLEHPTLLRHSVVQLGRIFKWRNAFGVRGEGLIPRWESLQGFLEHNGPVVYVTAWEVIGPV